MNVAIIVASGKGARMNVEGGKQFLPLLDKPLLSYSIDAFERCSFFENIIVVVNEEEINKCKKLVAEENFKKVTKVVAGGKKRQDSVANGLFFLPPEATIVAIHDGARPLITPVLIDKACSFLDGWDGVILGVLVQDTVKLVEEEMIAETLPRQKFLLAQTPQIFLKDPLLKAYEFARDSGFYGTDDASLLERLGYRIRVVMGSYENIKVTTSVDLMVAEEILKKRKEKN